MRNLCLSTFNIIFLLLWFSFLLSPRNVVAQTGKDVLALKAFLDPELEELFSSVKAVGGSVAFVENGQVTYSNGFGFADREREIPATASTLYRAASMTKTMTAVAILKLQKAGKLNINDPINHYLPELHLSDRTGHLQSIRIVDILTHFSGLPSDVLNGMIAQNEIVDNDWQIDYLNQQPLSTSANFNQAYSNVGYGLLSQLIARVSGQSYAQYLQKELFLPLGMTTAQVGLPANGMTRGYVDGKPISLDISRNEGASSATASVLDMTEFLKLLLNQHPGGEVILSPEGRRLLQRDYVPDSFLPIAYGYGLGLDVRRATLGGPEESRSVTLHKHSGNAIAFHGEFGYIPELGVGVIIMTNTSRGFLACSTKDLLDLYLQHRYATSLKIDYTLPDHGLSTPIEEAIIGSYNIGAAGLEVTSPHKFTFKTGGAKAILRQRPGTMTYDVRLRLFGIVPIKVKDVVFEFVSKEGRVFLRQVDIDRRAPEYLGERIDRPQMTAAWKSALGKYTLTNPIPAHNERFDYATANIQLVERNGWPVISIKTKGMKYEMALTIVSDKLAITGGIGRHAGDPVQLLPGGRLRFSGMELQKQ